MSRFQHLTKKLKYFFLPILLVAIGFSCVSPVFASPKEGCVDTALFGTVCDEGKNGAPLMSILDVILRVLVYGIGALAIIGFVVSGIKYSLSSGDSSKVAEAKKQMVNITVGLIAYAFLYTFLKWLIPTL